MSSAVFRVAAVCCFMSIGASAIEHQGGKGISLSGSGNKTARPATAADLMKDLRDETVFLKVGDDMLTWGDVKQQVGDSLNSSLNSLFAAASDPMNDVRLGAYANGASRLVRRYLMTALVAQEARRCGITVDDAEFQAEAAKLAAAKPGEATRFQCQYMTNAVYQRAYAEKCLRPGISVSNETVAALIKARHEANLAVPLTNELFRAQTAELRERLVRNEVSWGEAAEESSDCADCSMNDGDCGTWDEDEDADDRPPALLKAAFTIPANTVSEVIETDDAFHLIKVAGRYDPTAKAREEDGEVATADVRHIQIDKWTTDPEFTEETARKHLEDRMLARALKTKQAELLKDAKIECVIPLYTSKGNVRPPIVVKQPRQNQH